jgi:hypothetical protein
VRQDLQPGNRFPEMELPDHAGNRRRLSELPGGDPLLLHFARGYFCQGAGVLRRLAAFQSEVEVAYTRTVTVTTEPSEIQAAFMGVSARPSRPTDPWGSSACGRCGGGDVVDVEQDLVAPLLVPHLVAGVAGVLEDRARVTAGMPGSRLEAHPSWRHPGCRRNQ